jgi:hypothetical protein
MKTVAFDDHRQTTNLTDNLEEMLPVLIQKLNNKTRTLIQISLPIGELFVTGGNGDRVAVDFSSYTYGHETGIAVALIDPSYSEDSEDIMLTTMGQADNRPLYLTASKMKAIEVALYFLRNDRLPAGETWSSDLPEDLINWVSGG